MRVVHCVFIDLSVWTSFMHLCAQNVVCGTDICDSETYSVRLHSHQIQNCDKSSVECCVTRTAVTKKLSQAQLQTCPVPAGKDVSAAWKSSDGEAIPPNEQEMEHWIWCGRSHIIRHYRKPSLHFFKMCCIAQLVFSRQTTNKYIPPLLHIAARPENKLKNVLLKSFIPCINSHLWWVISMNEHHRHRWLFMAAIFYVVSLCLFVFSSGFSFLQFICTLPIFFPHCWNLSFSEKLQSNCRAAALEWCVLLVLLRSAN